jgi:fatty-acyl-CoA synthase
LAALQLVPGAPFDPADFAAFLAAQPDLGTKSAPRYVRVSPRLPTTATNKVRVAELRALGLGGRDGDELWRRPGRDGRYRPLTSPADR